MSKPQRLTLADLLSRSLYDIWRGRASEDTNAYNGATILGILGKDLYADKVTATTVLQLTNALRDRGLKTSSINRHLSTLSVMLRLGQDLGAVKAIPRMRYQREPEHRTRVLTFDQERNLFAEIRKDEVRRLCVFLVETGLRLGEALKLRWEEVNGLQKSADFRGADAVAVKGTKTGKPRLVPLTARAQTALMHDGIEGLLNEGPFTNLKAHTVHTEWNRAKAALALSDDAELVPHCLRHTFASRLVQAGVDLVTVKTLLGHSTLQQTLRYAHMSPGQATHAANALEALRERAEQGAA